MGAKIDLTGQTFSRLTVIKEAGRDKQGLVMWQCKCSCGNTCVVRGRDLRSGNTKSCGCLNHEISTVHILEQTIDHSNPNAIRTKKLSTKNTSGVRGVCPVRGGKWAAYIGYKGKQIRLGFYSNFTDAVEARKEAEKQYYKEYQLD